MSSRETDEKEQLRLLGRLTAGAVHQEDGPSTVKLRIQAFVCGVDAIALSTRGDGGNSSSGFLTPVMSRRLASQHTTVRELIRYRESIRLASSKSVQRPVRSALKVEYHQLCRTRSRSAR